jgi:pyruvate-formate lyase
VNLRLARELLTDREQRGNARALIETYFALGNMQLQINVVDQQTLRLAVADPESYLDLIVGIGGYSEYFHLLTPELRATVLERTIHGP